MRFFIIGALAFLCVSPVHAEDALFEKVTKAIKEQCPKAEANIDQNTLAVKYDTMVYSVHHPDKIGEVSRQARQEEGPRLKGFILRITRHEGKALNQMLVPQTLQGPYFPTFIDTPATKDGKGYYHICFSYGLGLDPKLKKAIFGLLPRDKRKTGFAGAYDGVGDLLIAYSSAGLTSIRVDGRNRLDFTWYTSRLPHGASDRARVAHNIHPYDKHTANIWLTQAELKQFENWIKDNGLLEINVKHPELKDKAHGPGVGSALYVVLAGDKLSLSWTDETKVPNDLKEALNKLVKLCHQIRKSRENRYLEEKKSAAEA